MSAKVAYGFETLKEAYGPTTAFKLLRILSGESSNAVVSELPSEHQVRSSLVCIDCLMPR